MPQAVQEKTTHVCTEYMKYYKTLQEIGHNQNMVRWVLNIVYQQLFQIKLFFRIQGSKKAYKLARGQREVRQLHRLAAATIFTVFWNL